jgi:hypothetical protein
VGRAAGAYVRRQKELGVIPADAELTARHAELPAWEDMPDELKPVLAREMEVWETEFFSGFGTGDSWQVADSDS